MNKDDDRYEYGNYLRSNEHSLSSSENKAWKKIRPVRNNENNSKLAKFATYDGFMVKKKNTCFSQFIKPTVKNANFICRISPQAKPNLLAALQNVSVKQRYNNTQPCFPTNWHRIKEAVYGFPNIPTASPLNNLFSPPIWNCEAIEEKQSTKTTRPLLTS